MKAQLSVVGNVVRKTGNPHFLEIECAKTKRAHDLGDESGLFLTPKVIRFNVRDGELDFERLTGLRSLDDLWHEKDPRLGCFLVKAGRALSAVHAGMRLPPDLKLHLPGDWSESQVPTGFLHGDFTLANVFVQEPTERFVILDWSAAPILHYPVTFGPVCFDIHWFLFFLYQTVKHRSGAAALAEAFWHGYESRAGCEVSAAAMEMERVRITPLLKDLVFQQLGRRQWHKKGLFLMTQSLVYYRWRCFRPGVG